jgi:hypothetical protein
MTFKMQMESDLAIFFNENEFAEPAIYNGLDIKVIPNIEKTDEKGNTFTSEGRSDRAIFSVLVSDVLEPQTGDSLIHNSIDWEVVRLLSTSGGVHKIECIANESAFGR